MCLSPERIEILELVPVFDCAVAEAAGTLVVPTADHARSKEQVGVPMADFVVVGEARQRPGSGMKRS